MVRWAALAHIVPEQVGYKSSLHNEGAMMGERKQLIRSKAPLRISFAGGGTDVPPYCDEQGGAVLNSTIDRFAYCTISPRKDNEITIRSLDYGVVEQWTANGDMFGYDGNLDLIKAVLNHFEVDRGFDMFLHCDAPPGSGLGSSSTVIVSIIGAMVEWLNEPMSPYDIANLAYVLERKELGLAGGKQDQYASVFGASTSWSSGPAIPSLRRLGSRATSSTSFTISSS